MFQSRGTGTARGGGATTRGMNYQFVDGQGNEWFVNGLERKVAPAASARLGELLVFADDTRFGYTKKGQPSVFGSVGTIDWTMLPRVGMNRYEDANNWKLVGTLDNGETFVCWLVLPDGETEPPIRQPVNNDKMDTRDFTSDIVVT